MGEATRRYVYNEDIINRLETMINRDANSSETVLVPAYSYLAEVLRNLNIKFDIQKEVNILSPIYANDESFISMIALIQELFFLYYIEVPNDIIDFVDTFVENCMSLLSFEILNHISKTAIDIIDDTDPNVASSLTSNVIRLQNKIVWRGQRNE